MNNLDDLPEDSDSSDEDYIPDKKVEEAVSEVESDGDLEEPLSGSDNERKSKGVKRKKQTKKVKKKVKKNETTEELNEPSKPEEPKTSVDDLWADFIKDTGFKSKNDATLPSNNEISKTSGTTDRSEKSKSKDSINSQEKVEKTDNKVKITQVFEFAGEEVKVEKEVDANSAEARLLAEDLHKPGPVKKPAGLKGIGSVLSQIGKKQKLSILEKTKLDWSTFKKDENLEEELETHNRGKDGFLARQDFLQRTDVRQFEIEKGIRDAERAKRFNSTL